MIEYEDFSLKIEPKRGEVYPVIVLHSPAGEGRSSFTLPFNPDEIGDILFDLGWTVRGSGHIPLRDVSPAATRTRPQQIGDQLFSSLFSGTVRSLLDHSLGMIHGRQRGLRIKLHIDPEDPSLAQLASLPWEFLYRKEKREFLNLSRFTPIIRYLDVQSPYTPLSLELPLRILVVISDPADYDRLDLDRERELIATSWAKHEGVQVDFMEEATILALQDRMVEQPYHVLHYMGHGGFDERSGRGVLVMEDEDGQGAIVDGNTLGILLRDIPTMRLAFLNACETARVTKEKGLDPFAGVAAAMVMAGIPAVVAMQFPVSDQAAITFSQKFYPLLARGEPVDAAVAEGRRAICLANSGTMEWGTPVLFLRAPQGVIFQVSETQREKVPLPQIPELPEELDEELEQRLADIYTRGLSFFWLEEWEKAARSFQTIVDARPDYEDAANKLAEAKQQANLQALYTQAQEAQNAGDWVVALAALEQLVAEAPDYKGTAERLQIVRRQKQLTDLYSEAKTLHQAQEWLAVVNVFAQIHTIEPEYPDSEGLLTDAEQQVAAQKRQEELKHLYSLAVREMDSRQWQEAHQLLAQVQEMEPGFQETEQLLARVEQEIEREEKERKLQEQVATFYEQALGLAQAKQWQQVLVKVEEIQNLDPEFADPEGLFSKAQEAVAREEEEARRQNELATLYAEAVRLHEAGQYQEALEKLGEVQARDPRYPDRQNVQAHARKNLDALAQGVPSRRGLPRWAIPAISSAVLLAGILATIFGGQFISSLISDSITDGDQPAIVSLLEPTEIETPAEPTDTPTDSEAPAEPTDVPTQIDAPAESVALTEGEYECTDPLGCVEIGPGDPVHFAYALTLSGPNEIIGVDSRNGLNIAIDEWGQILGHDIMLTGESDQCPGEGGQVAATKLAADPSIVAVIGTSCSSAARVAVPLLSQAGFVIISPSNTSPELTIAGNENQHPGYARTSHSDAVQSKAAAEFVYNDLGLRKGATIHDGRNYTKELERVFAEEFQALGGEITGQQAVDPNQTDFISVLTNIATGNPEIIFYSTFNTAGSLPRQAQEIPGLENTILIGTDILFSPEFAEGAGDAIEGFLVTSPDFTFFNEAYANDFVPKYEEKYGTTPLSDYHAQAYDAFMIIAVGIESVAAQEADGTINIPRQALRDAIYATKDHQGLTGNLSCSPTGDCADPHIAFFEYHSGEYPPEKIWP